MAYAVQLTYAQIIALVDIALDTKAEDSPRFDGRTLKSLVENKHLVSIPHVRDVKKEDRDHRLARYARAHLTKKGEAYLEMAKYEYKSADDFLRENAA